MDLSDALIVHSLHLGGTAVEVASGSIAIPPFLNKA
jgi:hypothetical protein